MTVEQTLTSQSCTRLIRWPHVRVKSVGCSHWNSGCYFTTCYQSVKLLCKSFRKHSLWPQQEEISLFARLLCKQNGQRATPNLWHSFSALPLSARSFSLAPFFISIHSNFLPHISLARALTGFRSSLWISGRWGRVGCLGPVLYVRP